MRISRVKIITEMAKREINAIQLADMAGVSRCTVTSIRGGKRCSMRTAEKIAAALGVEVSALMEVE